MTLTPKQIQAFKQVVLSYYFRLRDLPWRRTDDPYAILVSEIMLQQTQVPRVIEKYKTWIRRFPTHFDLAKEDLVTILPYWTGLGYNRRALFLKQCADEIVTHYHGIFPTSNKALERLPGVGSYTAKAICVYAYNQPLPLIETNVRAIFIHHFFSNKDLVDDTTLLPLVEQTMDRDNPRQWFNALMDYGTYLKEIFPNPSRSSAHYSKQKPLKGSVREVRGWIIKQLATKKQVSLGEMLTVFDKVRIQKALEGLMRDGLIKKHSDVYLLK